MSQLLPLSIILGVVFLLSLNTASRHPFLAALIFVVTVIVSLLIFDIAYYISKYACNYIINPDLLSKDPVFYSKCCEIIGYIFSVFSASYICPIASDWLVSFN